jgi:hypothetical protein
LGTLTLVCDLLRVPNVLVSNASIFTPNARLFETSPSVSGHLMILYGTATEDAQEPSLTGTSYLSIGNLSLPLEGGWRFLVSGRDWSPYFFGVRGLFVLVAGEGSYWIVAEGPSRGFLGPTEDSSAFPILSNGSFFPAAYFTFIPATPTNVFVESAALALSGHLTESFRPDSSDRHPESQLAETAAHAGTDRFSSSANLDQSQLAETVASAESDRHQESQLAETAAHAESDRPRESQLTETAAHAGTDRFSSSTHLDESQLAETVAYAESDRHPESQLAETAAHAGTDRFSSSASLDESQLAETVARAGSDRFSSSATLGASQPSGSAPLSTGSLVGIVLAAVAAVVALIVGLIAWRHCSSGSKAADGPDQRLGDANAEYESPYQTGALATMVSPDVGGLSDELADDVSD